MQSKLENTGSIQLQVGEIRPLGKEILPEGRNPSKMEHRTS